MYRRSRSPASFSDRSLGSYNSGLSYGGYNTSDLVNTYSPRNRSVQRVINSDLGIHERSRSPLRDYSSPVSRATSVRPLPTLPPSPTLRRRDLGLGSDSRLSPIDWSSGEDYNFSVKPKSYYDFPSTSSARYNSYSSIGIKRPQRTDYSDYFRPLLTTKPMLKSGYVPRPRSERESAAEPIVRERKLIKFREITNDILSRVKRKVSWVIPDEISSPLIDEMKSVCLDATKENINESSRSRDNSLTKYGSREALNRDSSLTRYGSKETLSRDCSLTRPKPPDESGSPKSLSRRSSSSHSTDRLSPRNLMRLATSRIKDGDLNTMEAPPKLVPRKKSLGAIHKERKSRKSSLDGLTATEERSINYSVIADQIRRSRESSETKHHSPEKPEPEATPAGVEESVKPESPPAIRARCRRRTEPPDEAPRPINRMHRKSVKYKVDKPEPRSLDAPEETLAADIPVEHKANLSITETNISKTEDVLLKQNFNQSKTFKNEVVEVKETPVVDKCSSNDAKGPEKKLSKSSSGEKVLKKALKTDKEKSSLVGKKESKTTKSSTGKLKLGSKTNVLDNSSTLLPISPTQLEKGETETRAEVKPDLIELKADPKESEEIVVVCKLPKKAPTSEAIPSKPIPVDQNVVVSIVKASKSILVTDGERTTKILNIPTKLEAISENSNSSSGGKREERKEESSQKQAEVNVIHTVVLKGKTKEDSAKVEEMGNNNTRLKSIPDVIQSTISNIPLELKESNITPLSPKSDKQQLLPINRSTSSDTNEVSPTSAPLNLIKTDRTKKEKVTKPLTTPKSGDSEASSAKQAEKKTDIPTSNNTSNFSSKPDIVQSQIIDDDFKPHPNVTTEKDSKIDSTTSRLKFLDPYNSKNNFSENSLEKTSHFRITTQTDSSTSKPFAAEKSKPYKKSVTVPNVDLGINYKENATSFSSDNIPVSSIEKNSKLKGKSSVKVESSGSTVLPQLLSPAQKLGEQLLKSDASAPLLIGTLPESKPGVSKENVSKNEEKSLDQKLVKISNTKQKVYKTNELTERSKIADKSIPNMNYGLGTKSVSKNENSSLSSIQKDSAAKSIEVELNTCIDENKQKLSESNLIAPVLKKATVDSATSKQEKSDNFAELPKSPKAPKDSIILPDLVSKDKKLDESKPLSKTEKLEEHLSTAGEITSRTKKVEEKLPDTKQVSKTNDYSKRTDVSKSKLEATSKSTELISKTKINEGEVSKSKQSNNEELSKNSQLVSKIKMEDALKLKEPVLKTKLEATSKSTELISKTKIIEGEVSKSKQSNNEELSKNSQLVSKIKMEDALKLKEPVLKTKLEATSKTTEPTSKWKQMEDEVLPKPTQPISKLKKLEGTLSNSEQFSKSKKEDALLKSKESISSMNLKSLSEVTELNSKKNKLENNSLSNTTENVCKPDIVHAPDKLSEFSSKSCLISDPCSKIKKEGDLTKPLEPISKVKKLDGATSKINEKITKRNTEDPVSKPLESIPKKLETAAPNTTEQNSEKKKLEILSNATENVPNKKKIDEFYPKQLEPVSKLKKLESASLKTTEPDVKAKMSETLSKITENLTEKKQEENIPYSSETNSAPKKFDEPVHKPIEAISKNKDLEDISKTSNFKMLIEETSKTKKTVIPPKMTDDVSNKKSDEATPKTISKLKTINKEINKEESISDSHTSKSAMVVSKEPYLSGTKCKDATKQIDTPSNSNKLESKEPTQPPETISESKELKKSVSKSESVSKEVVQGLPMPLIASKPCPAPETILEAKKSLVPDLLNHVGLEGKTSKPSNLDNVVADILSAYPKPEKKSPPPRAYGLRFRYNQPQRSSYSSDSDSSSEEESESSISDFSCDEEGNKKGPCYVEKCNVSCHQKCEKLMPNLCGVNQKLLSEVLETVKKGRSLSSPDPITPNRIQKSRVRSTLSNQTTITTLSSVEDSPVKPKDPSKKLRFRKYDIDDFVFLKLLGKGSFGKVLLAELKGHNMYFAIKCLRKDVVLEDDDVESTMIERRVLALGTQHPYMCKLYCTFQTKSYLFFVMEYLNGGDLMFHIQESRPFEVKRAMFYGAEIVSALKFLHKRGIVYRDIKLDNVMLDADGHVRLVDFGMCQCRIYREECMPYNFCGTPNYIAPEIILGQKYNQSVDWWSLGVLLFEMLAGRSPFVGTDEDELFWCICNEEPFYPRFLSKESKDILENLLVKYPNKRLGMPSCPNGEIQDHPFFSTIDWDKLEKKQIPPPFKPTVLSAHDTNNFDSSFTMDSPTLSPVDPEILASMDQGQFQGFSYTNPHTTD